MVIRMSYPPEDITQRIALPITLLASWFIIWVLLSIIILSSHIPLSTPTQLKQDCFLRRNHMRDKFNLHLTNKNHNRNNRSVLALGYCTIFTPRRRSKKKSLISMSGGQEERDTMSDEIVNGYIDDSNEFFCLGLNVTSMPSKGF